MKFKLYLLFFLLTIFFFRTRAQDISFEHLTDNNGLIGTSGTSILKDSRGYMWFGFIDGISKYNGYDFKNYISNTNNHNSIADNYVRCMFETKNNNLLIGFQYKGLCLYNRETDTFTRLNHLDNDTNSLINDNLLTIFEDSQNNVWIGTRGGLDKFDISKKSFKHYNVFPDEQGIVSSIAEDKDHNLWLIGKGLKICKFNVKNNTTEYISFAEDLSLSRSYYHGGTIICDSKNNLWIGSENQGIIRYNISTKEKRIFNTNNKSLKTNVVFSLMEDSENKIWIGTDGAGLYLYDYNTNSLQNFQNNTNDNYSVSGNGIYYIYESEPGVVWVAAYASGINVYKKYKKKFHSITTQGKEGFILNQKSVLSIGKATSSDVWIGTDGGGLNLVNPITGNVKFYTKENANISCNIITSIEKDNNDNLWLGTFGKGLGKIEKNTGLITNFSSLSNITSNKLQSNHVWSLLNTKDCLWIGLANFGIERYNYKNNSTEDFYYDSTIGKKAVTEIKAIIKDSKGRTWFGSDISGLLYLESYGTQLEKILHNKNDKNSISDNDINDIYEDKKGTIWVATKKGGLNRLVDRTKNTFKHFGISQGLSSINIKSIQEDNNGDLWLSTNHGISLFKIKENKFINFDSDDGLVSKEFNINSSYKSQDGLIYFGGTYGLNYFNPDSIHYNVKKPITVLTDFKIFNTTILPAVPYEGKLYLQKSIDLTKQITLNHADNVFSIEFAALDFLAPQKNKYAYRLIGFHNHWNAVSHNKRFATYTNLDPGDYEFQVIASNNDGVWNYQPTILHIKILPPWWKTIWFRAAAILLLLCLFFSYFYWRINSVRKINAYLSKEVERRTFELLTQKKEIEIKNQTLENLNKTKDKFFSIIGHDLKGPVNALTFLTDFLYKDWDQMDEDSKKEYVRHIDTSTKQVKNLVLSLLEWARTQSGQVIIEAKILNVLDIVNQNVLLLQEQAKQKNIIIEVEGEKNYMMYGDQNMINTIFRNVLSNSIKYTYIGGTIKILVDLNTSNFISIAIIDQGIGMSEKTLKQIFALDKGPSVKGTNKETGTGLGMIISQEFAILHKWTMRAESTLGKGTTIYLELPALISGE